MWSLLYRGLNFKLISDLRPRPIPPKPLSDRHFGCASGDVATGAIWCCSVGGNSQLPRLCFPWSWNRDSGCIINAYPAAWSPPWILCQMEPLNSVSGYLFKAGIPRLNQTGGVISELILIYSYTQYSDRVYLLWANQSKPRDNAQQTRQRWFTNARNGKKKKEKSPHDANRFDPSARGLVRATTAPICEAYIWGRIGAIRAYPG